MPLPSFIEAQFPVELSYGSSGGPKFFTTISQSDSGAERRQAHWREPLREYEASTGIQSLPPEDQQNGLARLIAFHTVAMGQSIAWRWKDWSDYSTASDLVSEPGAHDQPLGVLDHATGSYALVSGDGTTTAFQLIRIYQVEGVDLVSVRTIRKPVASSVRVTVGGVESLGGWTLDATTGVITFAVAPAKGASLQWGGEYDVPCRFGDDHLPVRLESYLAGSVSVPVREVRL